MDDQDHLSSVLDRLPLLFEMLKAIRRSSSSSLPGEVFFWLAEEEHDFEEKVEGIVGSLIEKLKATSSSGSETNQSRSEVAVSVMGILSACQEQCERVLAQGCTDVATTNAISEMLKELRLAHHNIVDDLQRMVIDLTKSSQQQISLIDSIQAAGVRTGEDLKIQVEQLVDQRQQSESDLMDLLSQLREAQQKLGEAHRFIAKYMENPASSASTAAAAAAPTSSASIVDTSASQTDGRVNRPVIHRHRQQSREKSHMHQDQEQRRNKAVLPASPPKSLRAIMACARLLPPPPSDVDEIVESIASSKIIAAGLRMARKTTRTKGRAMDNNNNNEEVRRAQDDVAVVQSDDQPNDTTVLSSMPVAQRTEYGPGPATLASSVASPASLFAENDRAWLFQFRAEVQQAMDSHECSMSAEISAISAASSMVNTSRPAGSLAQCLSIVRKMYHFHKATTEKATTAAADHAWRVMTHTTARPALNPWSCSMEQRLYLVMERKYGLRSLAVQNTALFLQTVERLTDDCLGLTDYPLDHPHVSLTPSSSSCASIAASSSATTRAALVCDLNELAVFLAAFRNEIECDFYQTTQLALVKAVNDLLLVVQKQRQQLQGQKRTIGNREYRQSVGVGGFDDTASTSKKSTDHQQVYHISLSVQEWREQVLRFLYNDDDIKRVVDLLKQQYHQQQQQQQQQQPGLLRAREVCYDDVGSLSTFTKALLISESSSKEKDTNLTNSSLDRPADHSRKVKTPSPSKVQKRKQDGGQGEKQRDTAENNNNNNGNGSKTAAVAVADQVTVIDYSDFLRCVLDYQLLSQRRFLSSIHQAFLSSDEDGDGLLSAAEMVKCFDLLLPKDLLLMQSSSSTAASAATNLLQAVDKTATALATADTTDDNNNDAHLDSPLYRRKLYVKKQTLSIARRKQAAMVAAKSKMREDFVAIVTARVKKQFDEYARVNYTTLCHSITQLFT